jgi:hypothetical protein
MCGRFSPHPAWYHFPEDKDENTDRSQQLEVIR